MSVKIIQLQDFDGAIVFRAGNKNEEIYINDKTDNEQSEWTRFMVCYLAYALGKIDWISSFEEKISLWEKEEEKMSAEIEKAKLKAGLTVVQGGKETGENEDNDSES
tara:strand:+ start:579 stop:899 length:321 start_codon:yes stop_codon:yes gene_type:complete